jgi:hypothetical protein
MSDNWANRRHIRIPSESILRGRRTYPQFEPIVPLDEPDYSEHGPKLLQELEESIKYCKREEKVVKNENVFFVIETVKEIGKEETVFNTQIIFSLQTGNYSAIVSADEKKLAKLREKLKRYSDNNKFKTYVNEIKRISKIKLEKIDPDLDAAPQNIALPVEIDLLPNLGKTYNHWIINKIREYLKHYDSRIIDSLVYNDIASIRAIAKPEIVRTVVQGLDSVWQARKAPIIHIDKPQSFKIGTLPNMKCITDGEQICLLDTGVDYNHPLLKGAITDACDFTLDGNVMDFNSHGTFDAGLAVYGDLEGLEKRKTIDTTALLINAKILSDNQSNNWGYVEDRITRAVEKFHGAAKIFSLSIMTEACATLDYPSKLGHTLDELATKFNVLFVVSAGNVKGELYSLVKKAPYPAYLGEECCKLFWGGEACTAITVGGISLKSNNISLAKKDQPSPFTRRGESGQRAKPDVVSNGGNIEFDPKSMNIGENDPELGVVSLGLSEEPIACSKGTSCSAPIVANIAANILKEYPDASSELLKALIIHSAKVPDAHHALNVTNSLKKVLYGKGAPSVENAVFCNNSAPTFIIEDSVKMDETASIPIYVPKIMRKISGLRKIKVTLAYNPPVDVGVKGYTLIDLDFQLHKQIKLGKFQQQRANWDDDFRISWDNVKTGTFSWSQSGWGFEWLLEVIPTTRLRNRFNYKDYEQKFAAVITIEDPTKKQNIYDSILQEQRKAAIPVQIVKKSVQQELFAEQQIKG